MSDYPWKLVLGLLIFDHNSRVHPKQNTDCMWMFEQDFALWDLLYFRSSP